jgi:Rap1a immunity proteins
MRNLIRAGFAILVVLSVPVPAALAAVTSGNRLYESCAAKETYCIGYITAVIDALDFVKTSPAGGTFGGWEACVPQGATIGQAIDIVTNWLVAHPEKRHFSGAGIVAAALAEAFPCKP